MFFLENLRKKSKICDENLLKFSGRSGAKESVVDYRRCLSPCRRRVPCIPVRVILIVSSYGIPVSFALFDHFLLGSGCLGLFAFSSRLVSAWFFPVVFYLTDSKGAKECKSCRAQKMLQNATSLTIVAVHTEENEPSKVRRFETIELDSS